MNKENGTNEVRSEITRRSVGTRLQEGLDALKSWGEVVEWGTFSENDGRLRYRIVWAGINTPGEALDAVEALILDLG